MKAVIMAGGKGTRIAAVRSDIPKPMIQILGKPILEYQIECLRKYGVTDIVLVTGHLGQSIVDYFGDGKRFGVNISYFNEFEPLGTAGALYKIENLSDDFLLLCGDTIFDIDFNRFIQFHEEHNAWASLVTHPNSHPYDSSIIVTETLPASYGGIPIESHKVIQWLNKEDERKWYKNRVNAGIEIISPKLLNAAKDNLITSTGFIGKVDLDRDLLKPLVKTGKIFAYDSSEYIKDMGTPDRLEQVEKDMLSGIIAKKNLSNRQKAVFLDRDGTLNKSVGFLTRIEQMELLPSVCEAIRIINNSGYLAILVTNQPQISRGELDFEELYNIHNKLETLLGESGAYLDALYFCPHHTDKGFEGERIEYKLNCECRKPNAGMLMAAAKDFNIDLSTSYMIGDSDIDIQAGRNAGCKKNIKISENYTLLEAVKELKL